MTTVKVVSQQEVKTRGLFDLVAGEIVVVDDVDSIAKFHQARYQARCELESLLDEIKKVKLLMRNRDYFAFENAQVVFEAQLLSLYRQAEQLTMAANGYFKRFKSLEFLSWVQQESGYPLFMAMDYQDSSGLTLSSEYPYVSQNLPYAVLEQYQPVLLKLAEEDHETDTTVTISATFAGLCPETTREKIKQARDSKLFGRIIIIAEAPEWQIGRVVHAKTDPLVVGMTKTEEFSLIDVFMPTYLEAIAAHKYTK